jgi:hypothetical protein
MAKNGFFVSRCKGASAPAEKSQAQPLQEGDHPSVRSGHERGRGLRAIYGTYRRKTANGRFRAMDSAMPTDPIQARGPGNLVIIL